MENDKKETTKKDYNFGSIQELNLNDIEKEVINDSVYLDVFAGSDVAIKENLSLFEGALDKIGQLKAYTYNYKSEEVATGNFPEGKVTGLLAQDIEKVYPIAVKEDHAGTKYVNYATLAPLLVQSINELNEIVKEQAKIIDRLSKKN